MGKADTKESEKRVNTVYVMLMQGLVRKHIVQYCAKMFNIGESQTDVYIRKARDQQGQDNDISIDLKRTEILLQHYDLYNKSYKAEDYRECRNILKQICDILGVNAPTEIKQNSVIQIVNLGTGVDPNDTTS